MKLDRVALTAAVAAMAGTFVLTGAALAQDKKVRWKMASSFAGTLDVVGEAGPRYSKLIDAISGGNLEIKFFEPGALVPPLLVFDPVSAGSIDAAWTTPGFHAGKIPASPWFTTVPFGPGLSELLGWLHYGGGLDIKSEIYGKYGNIGLSCNAIAPEASGWFRKEIKNVADLKGLKMRFFGLGAKVMDKLGVSTQLIAPGDIYPALELGTIDATELSFPSMDVKMGFHQVAKHYYFPGWHQMSSIIELLMNQEKWKALTAQQRAQIEAACNDTILWGMYTSDARQFKALQEVKAKGVTIHQWSPEILKAMRTAWEEVVKEESAKDPNFKKAHESYAAFRANFAVWREVGYLKD